ncbi:MAG: helix-turn-helix domain-containing protein [Azoarcus sp.]|jgi:hypothetical protein|nr:helix-turn-helix domain-containing protein [Azoarcus sp.]
MPEADQPAENLFPEKCDQTDPNMRKVESIVSRTAAAASILAKNMAAEAIAGLATMGINLSQIPLFSFLAYAARLQVEKLSVIGMLRRDKLVLTRTARVKAFLQENPGTANADDFLNAAYLHDVSEYVMRHFLPTRVLIYMALEPGAIEGVAPDEYTVPAPYSKEAKECVAAMNSISYPAVKTRPIAFEPVGVDSLLKEVALTADEAARLMRVAPKTLEDMCRDGRIPATVYTRYAKTGNYHFRTKKFHDWLENREEEIRKGRR